MYKQLILAYCRPARKVLSAYFDPKNLTSVASDGGRVASETTIIVTAATAKQIAAGITPPQTVYSPPYPDARKNRNQATTVASTQQ